ncbi:MAG: tripartite tricarboxylate transporter substrate binding protein [Pseudomonadota bacterium]
MNTRRLILASAMAWPALHAFAQDARPIRIIVPAPPGGPTDLLARSIAERTQVILNQPVVVENRAGGGGVVGAEAVARAAPDGLTFVLGHNQTHASNQAMMARLPYHVIDSFAPVARVATVHHALVVPANHRARDIAGLIAAGGRLSYASSSAGSASHVIAESFVRRAGLDAVHVPYRGAAPATTDTVAGVVDFYVATWPPVASLVREGRLRALEIGAPARLPDFPTIPTAAEAGVPYMAVDAWFGLFAPRGTPDPAITRFANATLTALQDPATTQRLQAGGFTLATLGPAEFAEFQRAELARWTEMVTLTGVRIEE